MGLLLNALKSTSVSKTKHASSLTDESMVIDKNRQCVWFMRQAGRYLPEYLETRKQAGSFLDLCFNPNFAVEVTHQPLRRFDLDAAILFSDILVIPYALGINVDFKPGEGPILERPSFKALQRYIQNLKNQQDISKLTPVFETVSNLRKTLPTQTDLIGFCGAPWTVLLYMLCEKPSKGCEPVRALAYEHPDLFKELINLLVDVSAEYLCKQVENGADIVQIFESWAVHVPHELYDIALKTTIT